MLQWNDLHPYNAVHVVRIPEALDLGRLRTVINGTLERHGLTNLTLDRARGIYHYHGGRADCEVKTIACGEGRSFHAEIEGQLNTTFVQRSNFNPFRFFVTAERNSISLGVAYFHAVADAESLVLLMKDIVDAYLGRNGPGVSSPVDLYPPRYDNLLRHCPGVLARRLSALPSMVKAVKCSCRPRYRDAENLDNGFAFFSLKPEVLLSLTKVGKSRGITLNDLFLALLMRGISPLAPDRTQAARRRMISVGCIVNIRKDLALGSRRTFGLFLGSFVVSHEVPRGISLMDLAVEIRRQTLEIKRGKLYLGTPLELAVARFTFSLFSTPRRKKFYQKNYPLWGGATNMNLNSLWAQPPGEKPIDYFRAVSTGPATPLVLSVTTVRDVVNIGLTYRSTVFSAAEIEHLKTDFLESLGSLKAHA
jgi:NRPS condensation-like uncharacterized protein